MNRFLREGLDPAMLHGLPCVRQKADAGRGSSGLEEMLYTASVESSHQAGLIPLIRNGVGYGFVFPYVLMNEANQPGGDLWVLPIRKKLHDFTTCIVYRDQPIPEYLSDFIAIIEKNMGEYQKFADNFFLSEDLEEI